MSDTIVSRGKLTSKGAQEAGIAAVPDNRAHREEKDPNSHEVWKLMGFGVLEKDLAPKDKDLTGSFIFTSRVHYVAYLEVTNTTGIITNNSEYQIEGNALKALGMPHWDHEYYTADEILRIIIKVKKVID